MVDIRTQGATIFAHSRRGQGREVVARRFAQDLEYEPAPYGFNLAETPCIRMSYSEDDLPVATSHRLVYRFHCDPLHALANAGRMRRADAIWTMLEGEWIAVALLQRLGLAPRVPVIANTVWMFEYWRTWSHLRRRLFRWLMADNFIFTVHAQTSLEIARAAIPERHFQISLFGISTTAFPITPPRLERDPGRPIRIYAIGNDRTRDWKTLMEAFGNDPRFQVRLVSSWAGKVIAPSAYANLEQPADITISALRANYAWADIVVVPMRSNVFSGITVALEGAALGKPVVSSRTGGVPTYFDEDEVVYAPPGDADALRDAALKAPAELYAYALRAQARFERSGYSAAAMMDRYVALTNQALSQTRGAASAAMAGQLHTG
jgi:glycosyltransferase involved in cell wall biosynthesis